MKKSLKLFTCLWFNRELVPGQLRRQQQINNNNKKNDHMQREL